MRVHEIHPMTPPEGFPPDKPIVFPQEVVMQYDDDAGMWVVSGNGELLCVTPHYWLAEAINILLAATEANVAAIQAIEDGKPEVSCAETLRSLPPVLGRVAYEPPPVQFPLAVEVEPYGGRYWAVEVNGQLLCVTLYRRGAEAVRGLLHGIEREVMERQVIGESFEDVNSNDPPLMMA
jgi:hypothetical protein